MKNKTSFTLLIISALVVASLLLSACGPSSTNPDGSVDVKVTLTDYKIESSLDSFQVGVPYHFIITNEGNVPHELMIMEPMMAGMEEMSMEEMDAMALAVLAKTRSDRQCQIKSSKAIFASCCGKGKNRFAFIEMQFKMILN